MPLHVTSFQVFMIFHRCVYMWGRHSPHDAIHYIYIYIYIKNFMFKIGSNFPMTLARWFLVAPPKDAFTQVGILGEAWIAQKKNIFISKYQLHSKIALTFALNFSFEMISKSLTIFKLEIFTLFFLLWLMSNLPNKKASQTLNVKKRLSYLSCS